MDADMTRQISELTDISGIIEDPVIFGFPVEFSNLFARTDERLLKSSLHFCLQNRESLVVFRNEDLRALGANPDLGVFSEFQSLKRFFRHSILTSNPPVHGPRRQLIARPLSPRNLSRLTEVARGVAAGLLPKVIDQEEFSFGTDFCERFTVTFWSLILDMTSEEMAFLTDAIRALVPLASVKMSPETEANVTEAMNSYIDVIAGCVRRVCEKGGNELIQMMVQEFHAIPPDERPGSFDEMIAVNVFDGVHTVAAAASNVIFCLLRSPDHLSAVRADRSLLPVAVAEGLRIASPIIQTLRCALKDVMCYDTAIPQGTIFTMLWAAGNRDPEVFPEPEKFDLRRKRNDKTFGGGIHICPGRFLAGMFVQVILETILAERVSIELVDSPRWVPSTTERRLESMRLRTRRIGV